MPLLGAQRRFARGKEWNGRREVVGFSVRPLSTRWSDKAVQNAANATLSGFPMLTGQISWDLGVPVLVESAQPRLTLEVVDARDLDDPAIEARARSAAEISSAPVHMTTANGADGTQRLYVFIEHLRIDQLSLQWVVDALVDALGGRLARPWSSWQADVRVARDLLDYEVEASAAGTDYWTSRMRRVPLRSAPYSHGDANCMRMPRAATVALSRDTGYFADALHALHKALAVSGPHVIGYAWGARPPAANALVSCVMNTLPSPYDHPRFAPDFRRRLWADFDHASVAYDDIVENVNAERRLGWSGEVDAWLAVESALHSAKGAIIEPLRLIPLKANVMGSIRLLSKNTLSLKIATTNDAQADFLLEEWVREFQTGD